MSRRGFDLQVKWMRKVFDCRFDSDEVTIADVKKYLAKKTGVEPQNQKLVGVAKRGTRSVVQDHSTLRQLGLKYGTKIMMVGTPSSSMHTAPPAGSEAKGRDAAGTGPAGQRGSAAQGGGAAAAAALTDDEKLAAIDTATKQLMHDVDTLEAVVESQEAMKDVPLVDIKSRNKELIRINEMFTRQLLALDLLSLKANSPPRIRRKELIGLIDQHHARLDVMRRSFGDSARL